MKQQWGMGFSALALAAGLAGCGGGPGTTSPTTGAPPTVSSAPAPGATTTAAADVELKTAASTAGQIVVDAEGKSVYFFTNDVKDSGTSACKDACVALWPAVTTTSDAPEVEGVMGTIGTINAEDGTRQVTINGLPIYYFAQDKEPGDILGQGVSDVWYLVSPAGDMIKPVASGY